MSKSVMVLNLHCPDALFPFSCLLAFETSVLRRALWKLTSYQFGSFNSSLSETTTVVWKGPQSRNKFAWQCYSTWNQWSFASCCCCSQCMPTFLSELFLLIQVALFKAFKITSHQEERKTGRKNIRHNLLYKSLEQ